ncbi:MAG: carbamoyltransferase N-terminal domain-containing protein, partial [Planctomycetota bacterium]
MVILGIGGLGYRDAAAALAVDGRIVAAAAEDRFTGRKHQGGWPTRAVDWCLRHAGLDMEAVDHVAVANNPWLPLRDRVLDWYGDEFFRSGDFKVFHIFHDEIHDTLQYLKVVEDLRRADKPEVHVVRHHVSHMAAAFLSDEIEEAALLVLDGRGEISTSSQGRGAGAAVEAFHVQE